MTRAKPKLSKKDRAKRLLLGLATKHSAYTNVGGATDSGVSALERSHSKTSASPSASGTEGTGDTVIKSPLVSATDAATVRPGMVLAAVAARGGQGVSEEAVDTLGMGVRKAIKTLVE